MSYCEIILSVCLSLQDRFDVASIGNVVAHQRVVLRRQSDVCYQYRGGCWPASCSHTGMLSICAWVGWFRPHPYAVRPFVSIRLSLSFGVEVVRTCLWDVRDRSSVILLQSPRYYCLFSPSVGYCYGPVCLSVCLSHYVLCKTVLDRAIVTIHH